MTPGNCVHQLTPPLQPQHNIIKQALAGRLQEQNEGLLREAKLSRAKLRRMQEEKSRVEDELAAALAAGASRRLRATTGREAAEAAEAEVVGALRQQLDRAVAQLRECLETIEGLETSLVAAERERDALQAEVEGLRHEQGGGELGRVAAVEEELRAARQAHETLRAKYARAKAALKACREEEGAVRRALGELQHQSLLSEHSGGGGGGGGSPPRGGGGEEARRLRARVRELEAVLRKVKEVDTEAQAAQRRDAERLALERRRLLEAEARMRAEAAAAAGRAAAAEARVAQLEGKVRRAKQACGEAQGEARELRRRFKEHVEETGGVLAELEKARGERARRAQELAAAQAALADTRAQLEAALARCVAWERERQGLLRELQVEKGRASGLEAAIAEAADRIVGYEEELEGVQRAAAAETAAAEVLRRTSRRLAEAAVGGGTGLAGAGEMATAATTAARRRGSSLASASSVVGGRRGSDSGGALPAAAAGPSPQLLDTLARLRQATATANAAALASAAAASDDGGVGGEETADDAEPARTRTPSVASSSLEDELATVLVPHHVGAGDTGGPGASSSGLGDLLARCRTLKAELAAVIEEDERLQQQTRQQRSQPPPPSMATGRRTGAGAVSGSNATTERL